MTPPSHPVSAEEFERQFLEPLSVQTQSSTSNETPTRKATPHPREGVTEDILEKLERQIHANNASLTPGQSDSQTTSTQVYGGSLTAPQFGGNPSQSTQPMMTSQSSGSGGSGSSGGSGGGGSGNGSSSAGGSGALLQFTPHDWEYVQLPKGKRVPTTLTPIANYQSNPNFQHGHLITTNDRLIVYGLRAGLLRILNRFDGNSRLLRGHKQHITDLKFEGQTSLLASASRDRSVIIWQLENSASDDDQSMLLTLTQPIEQNMLYFTRLEWHPNQPGVLIALTSTSRIYSINIPSLLNHVKQSSSNEIEFSDTLPGIKLVHSQSENENSRINDIGFSADNKWFATGGNNGQMYIFNADQMNLVTRFNAFKSSTDNKIFSFKFCGSGRKNDMMNRFLIVGGVNNRYLKLFDISNIENPVMIQNLTIRVDGDEQYVNNSILNHLEYDDQSKLLLAYNIKDSNLLVIHLKENPIEHTCKFDSIVELETKQPIISLTCESKVLQDGQSTVLGLFCVTTKAACLVHFSPRNLAQFAVKSPSIQSKPSQHTPMQVHSHGVPLDTTITSSESSQVSSKPQEKLSTAPQITTTPPSQDVSKMSDLEERLMQRMTSILEHDRVLLRKEFKKEREEFLRQDTLRQKELLDVLSKIVGQDLPDDISSVFDESIQTVIPTLIEHVEKHMNKKLDSIAQKLGKSVDESVRKNVNDALSKAFNRGLEDIIVPGFERSCQIMFKQISSAFTAGIEEQIKKPLESYYESMNKEAMRTFDHRVQQALKQLSVQPTSQQLSERPQQKETSPRDEILHLLQNKKYEDAFTRALSVQDLKFVVWVCQQVPAEDIFDHDPPLVSQPVCLSLLQQLGHDFKDDIDLKLDWIEKIIPVLDPKVELIARHVPVIAKHVHSNMAKASSNNPQRAKKFRIPMMLLSSFIASHLS